MLDEDDSLQLRIAIIGHTGTAEHRGIAATEDDTTKQFMWKTISEHIGLFIKSCIHCPSTTGGEQCLVKSDQHFMTLSLMMSLNLISVEWVLAELGRNTF